MKNKFKIITPSYNNSQWVEYNLASVLNQTYDNWEVVYINDNSTDDTLDRVKSIVGNNPKYTIIHNQSNKGATYNYFEYLHLIENNDIVVHLDGDDWLVDESVLEKLNELYNNTDCWMTYGGMLVWNGSEYSPTFPQNTPYDEFVHKHKFYRRDMWRASHLRTYRGFLLKELDTRYLKGLTTGEYYWHASDLAFQYAYMEIAGQDRIQPVNFYTYVYNQHPSITNRTQQRESEDNFMYEKEIRNRKVYQTGLPAKRLPLINVIGDYRERNSIPTKFSYVYNQINGEFDITLLQDGECLKYINGEYGKLPGIVIADIHEPPFLFNQEHVYTSVLANHTMFDYIFTYSDTLLRLPNSVFRNVGYECVLNKNVHLLEYPTLADESLFKLYSKSKNVSIITSNKRLTDLHVFRNECVSFIKAQALPIDVFGVGHNYIKQKLDGLKDYRYSVTIENGILKNYFTEKILDCFLTGTIPIYKGCPNIDEFFNTKGIIIFDTLDELKEVVDNINSGMYIIPQDVLEDNYNRALQYCYNNDRLFDKYLGKLCASDK